MRVTRLLAVALLLVGMSHAQSPQRPRSLLQQMVTNLVDDMGDMASRIGTGLIRTLNGNVASSARERPGSRQNFQGNPARQTNAEEGGAPNIPNNPPPRVNPNNLRQNRQRLTFRQFVDGVMSGLSNFVPRLRRRAHNRNSNNSQQQRVSQVSEGNPSNAPSSHHINRRALFEPKDLNRTVDDTPLTKRPTVQVSVNIFDELNANSHSRTESLSHISTALTGIPDKGVRVIYYDDKKRVSEFPGKTQIPFTSRIRRLLTSTSEISTLSEIPPLENISENVLTLNVSSRSGLRPYGSSRYQYNRDDPLTTSASDTYTVTANYGKIGFDFSDMDVLNSVYLSQMYQNAGTMENNNGRMGFKEGYLQGFNQGYDAGKKGVGIHSERDDTNFRNIHNHYLKNHQTNTHAGEILNHQNHYSKAQTPTQPHSTSHGPSYTNNESAIYNSPYDHNSNQGILIPQHVNSYQPTNNNAVSGLTHQNLNTQSNSHIYPQTSNSIPAYVTSSSPVNILKPDFNHQQPFSNSEQARPSIYQLTSSSSSNSGRLTKHTNQGQVFQRGGNAECDHPRCYWDYLMWYLDHLQHQ